MEVAKGGLSRNKSCAMAASPGNMYQKQALKKRQTAYLQPSSGTLSRNDKLKAEKDIPLHVQPSSSPTLNRSPNNMRKFSQISLRSDSSGDQHTDANGNTAAITGTPNKHARFKHHQVRYGICRPP